jgi:hypothetical protein
VNEFIDQFSDPAFKFLYAAFTENPEVEPFIKKASMDADENARCPDSAFAWQERRLFRIDDPSHAALSKVYMSKQANIPAYVREACDKALDIYGVKLELKTAEAREPSDDDYMLPGKKRWLVQTPEHVKMADEAFRTHKRELGFEEKIQACVNLTKKAAAHSIRPSSEVLRGAGLTMCDTGVLQDWVSARASATSNPVLREAYDKVASVVAQHPGIESKREELVKVAATLDELDRAAGFGPMYGTKLPDPMDSVFNTDKLADEIMTLAGRQVPLETLMQIDPEIYKDVFGEDLAGEFIEGEDIDPEQLKIILPTVPLDLQKALVSQLGI